MVFSSLVLTVAPGAQHDLVQLLSGDGRLELGESNKSFLPLVVETTDLREARDVYEWLQAMSQIRDVQLVGWTDAEC